MLVALSVMEQRYQAVSVVIHDGESVVDVARTRFLLRRAIARMHQVLTDLRLQVHPDKRFIGRAKKGGVIFWDLFCTRTGTLSLHR
jgi:hypothetical protein